MVLVDETRIKNRLYEDVRGAVVGGEGLVKFSFWRGVMDTTHDQLTADHTDSNERHQEQDD